jgi:hypothetical protein
MEIPGECRLAQRKSNWRKSNWRKSNWRKSNWLTSAYAF